MQFLNEYDEHLKVASKENEEFYKEEREEKAEKYKTIKDFEKGHTQNLIARDTFKQKITMQTTKSKTKPPGTVTNTENIELPAARYEN